MSYNKITVRTSGVLGEIRQFASKLENIPKALDNEFRRSVARNAIDALYGGVGQEMEEQAPQDSGAYAAGLAGDRGTYVSDSKKSPGRVRKANPIMKFRASGSNLSLDYGTNPEDVAYENFYGKHVEFSVNDYRPQIKQAIVNAVQEETARFIANITSRAIGNASRWRTRGVRFRKSA
jgi:hypothetical protein